VTAICDKRVRRLTKIVQDERQESRRGALSGDRGKSPPGLTEVTRGPLVSEREGQA
jgi:hypothetical protein